MFLLTEERKAIVVETADQKLEKAKRELVEAEQKLKDAKLELKEAKTGGDASEIARAGRLVEACSNRVVALTENLTALAKAGSEGKCWSRWSY